MCGIALLVGAGADDRCEAFAEMMTAIAPRGESQEIDARADALLGTARLKIVDREHAVQPWSSADDRWALCYNGELYNHNELRGELHAQGGRRPRSATPKSCWSPS